jgi:hypothetical protein
MTLRSVEDLIYTTIEKLVEEETNKYNFGLIGLRVPS